MKPSRRNKANERARAEKRAEGKPAVSRFERKFLAPDEIRERELAVLQQQRSKRAMGR